MQVLESRFQLQDQRVWLGKAKLLADRVVLKGLGYHRTIALDDIVEVRWSADELIIVCRDGQEVDMTIKAAALWKYELQARCGLKDAANGPGVSSPLPPESPRPEADVSSLHDDPNLEPEGGDSESLEGETEEPLGEQTEMFLQRESRYRIRNGFAEDRPQHTKRAEDPE